MNKISRFPHNLNSVIFGYAFKISSISNSVIFITYNFPKPFNPWKLGITLSQFNSKVFSFPFACMLHPSITSPNKVSSSKPSFKISSSTPVISTESIRTDGLEKSSFLWLWFSRTSSAIKGVDCKYSYKFLCHFFNVKSDKQGKTFNSIVSSKGFHSSFKRHLEMPHSSPANMTFSLLLSASLKISLCSFGIYYRRSTHLLPLLSYHFLLLFCVDTPIFLPNSQPMFFRYEITSYWMLTTQSGIITDCYFI